MFAQTVTGPAIFTTGRGLTSSVMTFDVPGQIAPAVPVTVTEYSPGVETVIFRSPLPFDHR